MALGASALSDGLAPGLPRGFLLWIDGVGGYLVCLGGTKPAMTLYLDVRDQIAELIFLACQAQSLDGDRIWSASFARRERTTREALHS